MRSLAAIAFIVIPVLGCGSSFKAEDDAGDDTGDAQADTQIDVAPDGTDTAPDTPTDIPPGCGDGEVDGGEECDDGNDTDGDGCDTDCTWSCHEDADCSDANMCTDDTCELSTHVCRHDEIDCTDEDPCTHDSCDVGEGCTHTTMPWWYLDGDDDGFGTPDDRVCDLTAPAGYVDNDEDCCDEFPVVNPAQTAYFVEPYTCGSGVPTWDYNCDGVEEQRYTDFGRCETATDGSCVTHEGWTGDSIPACGDGWYWLGGCVSSGGVCSGGASTWRVQTCR